jgi:endonuclease/exonuclease/phosphatase family metal-dependent hydrolase
MSAGRRLNRQLQDQALRLAARNPKVVLVLLGLAAVVALGYFVWTNLPTRSSPPPVAGDGKPAAFVFCSWNVENFFDDQDDPKNDDDYEDWVGTSPDVFRQKVDHLADGLLKMNGGVGPDVACLVEVESERCLSALQEAANARLDAAGHGDRKYTAVLFKGDNMGRRFAPAILTRLGVQADRTRKLGKRINGRILEGHLRHNGHELVVIAAHWTSRVTDKEGVGARRADYAEDCYGRVKAILTENPDADVVVCGDFNDEFDDPSIRNDLHATDRAEAVRESAAEPRLLDLFAHWKGDPPGTIYSRKWSVFDHICVARGLLDDKGWSCDPKTAAVFAPEEFRHKVGKRFEPFQFGGRNAKGERGYSDHFPVTVQLSVAGRE